MTFTLNRPWSNIRTDICELLENPTSVYKDIERTRKRDGHTDIQTDGQIGRRTDGRADRQQS